MRRMPWTMYLWPGLPQVWSFGSRCFLALAVGIAAAFNALLVTTFGWSELIEPKWRTILWVGFVGLWTAAWIWSFWAFRRYAALTAQLPTDEFVSAMEHYLKGDYHQAEQLFRRLLHKNQRDLDARLMLATLLRRSKRFEEAAKELNNLAQLEGSEKWELEITRERKLIADAMHALAEVGPSAAEAAP